MLWILHAEAPTLRSAVARDQAGQCYSVNFTLSAQSPARGDLVVCLAGRGQQGACVPFRVSCPENGIPRHQQFRTSLDDCGNCIVSHAAIDLDLKFQAQFLP